MEKCCSKCKEIKPLQEFKRDKYRSDGLYPSCKTCCKIKDHRHYKCNRDAVRDSQKDRHTRTYIKRNRKLKTKEQKQLAKQSCIARFKLNNPGYQKDRYLSNMSYKISVCLRARLNSAIRNNQKSGSAIKDLGCTTEELKVYLESRFLPGMSWENYGHKTWHIDHIVPLSRFDLSDPVQLKQACHFTNLQPLWAKDNLSKSNKIS